jgi:glycosyltransferase involved in cell wall biosynthesis
MRILLMAQFFPPDFGGEELHVHNLANTLASRGHEVAVATQRAANVPDFEVLETGVRVYRFPTAAMRLPRAYSTYRQHHPPIPDPLGVRELRRIVDQERPEIVHAHNWIVNSALALRRGGRGGGFGLVLTLHDYSHVCATKRLMRKGALCEGPSLVRCLACASSHYGPLVGPATAAATYAMAPWKRRAVDHVISVSLAVARGNDVTAAPNSSIIPNFIPDSLIFSANTSDQESNSVGTLPGEPFLLFVGDISNEKGVQVLLKAYDSLPESRPPLLLVGRRTPDTPMQLPAGAQLCFDWRHDDVMAAFRHCLFAILPSLWPDPCPTTVLESMASGCSVISTSVGGIVDLIVHDESGLLVSPGDVHELADAISRLLASAELRERLAAGARERVVRFTASVVVEQLEAVYQQVASMSTRQPGRRAVL